MIRVKLDKSSLVDSPRERSRVEVGDDGPERENEIRLLDESLNGRERVGSDWRERGDVESQPRTQFEEEGKKRVEERGRTVATSVLRMSFVHGSLSHGRLEEGHSSLLDKLESPSLHSVG